jgi:RNA polymerase sigma-70 factor (ECF subfamily)
MTELDASLAPTSRERIEQKFLEAYDQYSDAIFRHCYFRLFDRERGKDLLQEVFIRAWQYLCKGNEVRNMRAFLYRIANNLIIDEFHKYKELSLEMLQEEGFDPGKDETPKLHRNIEHKRILKTFSKLEDGYRDIIVLRYLKGLSPSEIAKITGETANTVSVRIYRGLKQLRSFLAEA